MDFENNGVYGKLLALVYRGCGKGIPLILSKILLLNGLPNEISFPLIAWPKISIQVTMHDFLH